MSPGQDVIFAMDPLAFGVMQVVGVLYDGRIQAQQLTTDEILNFDPHELEAHTA